MDKRSSAPYSLPYLPLTVFYFVGSVGLANPDEAFTVFYGERNPWCKCKTQ